MNYNNLNVTASHLRDVYLEAEKEYVQYLLQFDDIKKTIKSLNSMKPDKLYELAKDLIDRVDAGEFTEDEMEDVEARIIVLLAAIKDKTLIRGPLIRLPDIEDDLDKGHSR